MISNYSTTVSCPKSSGTCHHLQCLVPDAALALALALAPTGTYPSCLVPYHLTNAAWSRLPLRGQVRCKVVRRSLSPLRIPARNAARSRLVLRTHLAGAEAATASQSSKTKGEGVPLHFFSSDKQVIPCPVPTWHLLSCDQETRVGRKSY
jgi:hypothetical protein